MFPPPQDAQTTPPATSERPDFINPVSDAAGLNPAETSANQHNLDRSQSRVFPHDFQDFRVILRPVRYRFTGERSLVQAQTCPSGKPRLDAVQAYSVMADAHGRASRKQQILSEPADGSRIDCGCDRVLLGRGCL
jgi:hypothetical protein